MVKRQRRPGRGEMLYDTLVLSHLRLMWWQLVPKEKLPVLRMPKEGRVCIQRSVRRNAHLGLEYHNASGCSPQSTRFTHAVEF